MLLAACGDDEENVNLPEEPDAMLNLRVEAAEGQSLPEGYAHLFVFDADDVLAAQFSYSSLDELQRSFKPTAAGSHTYLLVMNVGADFMLPETRASLTGVTLSEFLQRLELLAGEHSDISTGIVRVSLEEGRITQATIEMQAGIVRLAVLELMLSLPTAAFPPYAEEAETRSVVEGYALRYVAEVWQSGGRNRLLHHVLLPTGMDTDSRPIVRLENLPLQACEVVLWADYVPEGQSEDHHYATSDLEAVTFNPNVEYAAGVDTRTAYAARFSVDLSAGGTVAHVVEMERPFARYRIVATDLRRYEQMQDVNDFPAWEDIEVRARYTSYFPSSYNVPEDRPNNAVMGYTYRCAPVADTDSTVQLATDYIWVDLTDSSVRLDLALTDRRTGDTISLATNLHIPYRRGYLTTLSGDFLTAGKSSGNITVDERWEGEYNVMF